MTRRGFLLIFGSIAAVAVATVTLDLPLQSPVSPVVPTTGWATGSTLRVGDVFTFAGKWVINPDGHASTGVLQEFIVTAMV